MINGKWPISLLLDQYQCASRKKRTMMIDDHHRAKRKEAESI
jgi:hypothetical protein